VKYDRRFRIAVAAGGATAAVLTMLPLVGMGNCCCCLWMWVGGALAAYLARPADRKMELSDGAFVGLVTGVSAAVITLLLDIVMWAVGAAMIEGSIHAAEAMSGMSDAASDWAVRLTYVLSGPLGWVISFAVNLVFFPLFCTLGGLAGAALFGKGPRERTQTVETTPGE
jgi:hypothetical protein